MFEVSRRSDTEIEILDLDHGHHFVFPVCILDNNQPSIGLGLIRGCPEPTLTTRLYLECAREFAKVAITTVSDDENSPRRVLPNFVKSAN